MSYKPGTLPKPRPRPVDVLADYLASLPPDVAARMPTRVIAAAQLHALKAAGLSVVPAFDLSSLFGFLGSVADKRLPADGQALIPRWMVDRAEQWRQTVRSWIPDERHEDD